MRTPSSDDARIRGLWCATLTPIDESGEVDRSRFRDHVHALLAAGVEGVAPFGTTGEGTSFSVAERRHGVDALIAGGIDAKRIAPATGCPAITDAIQLTRHAVEAGCIGALVLPPYFYPDVGDEGVYASFARLIDGVRDPRIRLYLYHIPQISRVPIGFAAIERLIEAYPGVIAGVKDSAGDLEHSLELVRRFPSLNVMVGHEPHLPPVIAAGGVGTICGLANLIPEAMRRLVDTPGGGDALDDVQRLLGVLREYPLMAAIKGSRAILSADPAWFAVRAPLVPLDEPARRALATSLRALSTRWSQGRD